ncbi:MAG: N-acetylglucosamine-6-phosphate deacetylase [Candidatus Hydrogenedentota bacterium]
MAATKTQETQVLRGRLNGAGPPMDVHVRAGRVDAVLPAGKDRPNAGSTRAVVTPPLFDMQVNGVAGYDLQDPHLAPEHAAEITQRLAAMGVAQWVPTLVTAAPEQMEACCANLARTFEDSRVAQAVPGIHIEGPHISPEDGPRGAHPRAHVCPPDTKLLKRLVKAANGKIAYITIAPELPGAEAYIRAARAQGIRVALGHHNATAEHIAAAVEAGASICTHLGNGGAVLLPRHHNPLWPQLADDRLTASLIADGHHLPDPVLKTFVRAKGPKRTVIVSDCVQLLGLAPGGYELFESGVDLLPNGKVTLRGTSLLAGSATPLLAGVLHASRVTDLTLEQACTCASRNPARLLGVRRRYALPEAGQQADFLCFTPHRGAFMPRMDAIYIAGRRIDTGKE